MSTEVLLSALLFHVSCGCSAREKRYERILLRHNYFLLEVSILPKRIVKARLALILRRGVRPIPVLIVQGGVVILFIVRVVRARRDV